MERRDFMRLAMSGFAGLAVADRIAGERLLAQGRVLKIANPDSRITDAVAINHLKRNGMAEQAVTDYVEFLEDYHRHPYAKIYRNRLTGEKTLVSSGLPMSVNGSLIVPGLERRPGYWNIGNNLMAGEIYDDGTIVVAPVVDQPNGRLAGQESRWKPQLYVGGIETAPVSGPILKDDLLAPGYATNNCIEWDYGLCKRVVRVIQGRLQERWVFASNPSADVSIVHNATGWLPKLGRYAINKDVEQITKAQFDEVNAWPLLVAASDTFFSNADPESVTVDGYCQVQTATDTWANVRDAAASDTADDSSTQLRVLLIPDPTTDLWDYLDRSLVLLDTSLLGGGASISDATFSVYGDAQASPSTTKSGVNVYSSNPASNTAVATGDYDSLGTTAFCDTTILSNNWSIVAYNDFAFNASGIAAIDKTGITKLGLRDPVRDVANSPQWEAGAGQEAMYSKSADNGSNKPKLVVTYTAGGTGPASVAGVESPTSVSGVESPTSVGGVN